MKSNQKYYTIISLVLILCIGGLLYALSKPSAIDNLYRLTSISRETHFDTNVVRKALLQLVPVGTMEKDVYVFLEQHGAVESNQSYSSITYLQKDSANVIHCFVASDPKRIGYIGDLFHIRFIFDNQDKLQDITIEDSSRSM